MLRALRDMTVRGGISFGAASSFSGKGLTVFGSLVRISSLHHDIYNCEANQ